MSVSVARVNPSNVASTWISANAGSGKTYRLVEHVVTLLLLGVTPERICCITYTKAAAGEMRARVLKALRDLLVMDDEACRARVRALTGSDDIALARSLFARVLDSPFGGLQLTTIHGFCQQILRRFPLESGLSPQFTVLEEAESDALQRIARQRVLEEAEGENELARALALIAERSGEYAFNELMRTAARQGEWWAQVRAEYPLADTLKAAIYQHHGVELGATEASIRAACEIPESLRALEQDALFELLFTQKGERRKRLPAHVPPGFVDRYERMVEHCRNLACAEESYAAALVASAFLDQYRKRKAEYQALDYDDLIHRTEQLLRNYGGWVMTKLDHRIDHLLVDEAQDTSPGQWRIVRTLVEELMVTGGGVGSGNVPRSLLVVGDEKQSIFSFQGADPRQFAGEAAHFAQLLEGSGMALLRQSLEHSYRSAQAILTLVDAVAALPPVRRGLSAAGTPPRHTMKRQDNPVGRVVLHPPVPVVEKPKPEAFTLPQDYAITETTAQTLAERMAAEIKQWVEAGRCLPGDILILLWRRQPYADCLIRALETLDIPVAGIDRLKLSEHLAVRDLMALMQWCGYEGDDLALAHVLRSPILGVSEQVLEDLAFGRPGSLWRQVRQEASLAAALESILAARHRPPYEFLTHVLEVSGARTRFAERFGEEVHEVLDELKAQAAQMPASLAPTIAAFADWITRSEREVKRQQETHGQAVRIMTVHGAKGLEAPIVLLVNPVKNPDTGRETSLKATRARLPILAFSDEGKQAAAYRQAKEALKQDLFDEYYRLLYVALTRPRDELHIFAAEPVREGSWYALVQQAMATLPTVREGESLVLRDAGTPTPRPPTPSHAASPMPAWVHSAPPSVPERQRVLSPSRLMEQPVALGGKAGANVRGVRIHRVLQFLQADSDANTLAQLLTLAAPEWEASARAQAASEIAALHASERWLWEYPAHAELSIGGTVNGAIYSGQIDRLVITPEAVVVVDYKTGSHVPATPEAAPEGYRLQMKVYKALLQPLYPERKIRSALLWTAIPALMWMDEAVDATPWPNLTQN